MNKKTCKKNKRKKPTKTQKRKTRKGGEYTNTKDICPFIDEYFYDRFQINPSGKYYNQYHEVCIFDNHIYYVTPKYFFRPNVQSIITSKFSLVFSNDPENIVSRKVRIENKYVSFFVLIQHEWYAITRDLIKILFPKHEQRAFFKLKPNVMKRHTNGLLEFLNSNSYEEYSSDTILLKDDYVEHISIDKDAVKCKFMLPSPFTCSYDNHPIDKRKPTDNIFMILDTLRYFNLSRSGL